VVCLPKVHVLECGPKGGNVKRWGLMGGHWGCCHGKGLR
jgi:hypothetical protein